jgi:IS30 family transposase
MAHIETRCIIEIERSFNYKEWNMNQYTHLSIFEREMIFSLTAQKSSITMIAELIGRNKSTVSRELSRNTTRKRPYSPTNAQNRAVKQHLHGGAKRKVSDPKTRELVRRLFLNNHWSPEQISNRLKVENNAIQLSTNTIYRAIYSGIFDNKTKSNGYLKATRMLRHHGKKRHKRGIKDTRGKIVISHNLEERPEEANDRLVPGYIEADTILGKPGESCIVTLVDRTTRYLLAGKVCKKASGPVANKMIELLNGLPKGWLKAITPDRGKEFAQHAFVTEKLDGIQFYFPAPHAPWARGTNENTNGLLREYIPKKADINSYTDEEVAIKVMALNMRPRKCLGYKSPFEAYYETSLHLT